MVSSSLTITMHCHSFGAVGQEEEEEGRRQHHVVLRGVLEPVAWAGFVL